jgi:hypothetical protein
LNINVILCICSLPLLYRNRSCYLAINEWFAYLFCYNITSFIVKELKLSSPNLNNREDELNLNDDFNTAIDIPTEQGSASIRIGEHYDWDASNFIITTRCNIFLILTMRRLGIDLFIFCTTKYYITSPTRVFASVRAILQIAE